MECMEFVSKLPFSDGLAKQEYELSEVALKTAKTIGLSHFYLDCSLEENSPNRWNKSRMIKFKEILESSAMMPIVHGRDNIPLTSRISQLRKAAISYIKTEILLASKIGAPVIIHGGQLHTTKAVSKERSAAINILANSLKELITFANDHNVKLLIENLPGFNKCHPFYNIFSTPDEFSFILSEVPLINMLFDIGHANVGNTYYESFIREYRNRISAICFSDNRGIHDTHSPLGMGTVNWKTILDEIHAVEWHGLVIFETRGASPIHGINFLKKFNTH